MKLLKITTVLMTSAALLTACGSSKKTSYLKNFHKEAKCEVTSAKIKMKADTVRVIYPEVTMFDFNKDEIKPDAKASLTSFAKLLSKYDRIDMTINGYTDNIGSADVNESLSRRRAESAQSLFTSNGIAGGRIQTNGRGASNPLMTNDTEEGRQANRRVEILLYERK